MKFAQELNEPAFVAREVLVGKDARQLARELLAMTQEEFSLAFKNSPMKRAKLRGLKRNAAVALGNIGGEASVPALSVALTDPEPLVRSHAAWALGRIGRPSHEAARRDRLRVEVEPSVVVALEAALLDAGG